MAFFPPWKRVFIISIVVIGELIVLAMRRNPTLKSLEKSFLKHPSEDDKDSTRVLTASVQVAADAATSGENNNNINNTLQVALPQTATRTRAKNLGRTCFVHVGKSAGTTVSCILGVETHTCKRGSASMKKYKKERDESPIAKHVGGRRFHLRSLSQCDPSDSFFVATRNPVTRIQSAFYYEQGKRRLQKMGCYSDFSELVMNGLGHNISKESIPTSILNMTCPQRAWAFVTGSRSFHRFNHHWFNYEFYNEGMHALSVKPKMFVVRSEHLAEDWNTADYMFGGNGTAGDSLFRSKMNERKKKDAILSDPAALKLLCRALCPEIQHYKSILQGAENLNAKQLAESISELQQMCPQETLVESLTACPGMPNFPLLPVQEGSPLGSKPRLTCPSTSSSPVQACVEI